MRPFPRPLLCLWLALLFAALPAHGERRKREEPVLPKPPPQPVPQQLQVPRGGKVEITLRVYGTPPEETSFLIRSAAPRGRLSAVRATSRETAVVEYQTPADLNIHSERILYAARTSAGVSAPAEVNVTILDDPVRLIVPDELRFEGLIAGTSARQELEIWNAGGSIAEGTVETEAPWQLEGDPRYRLRSGEHKKLALVFAPREGGPVKGLVRYTSHPDRQTTVRGEARAPLTVAPATLELRPAPGEALRRGVAEIANQTGEARTLTVMAPARVHLPPSLTVGPGETVSLTPEMDSTDTAVLAEEPVRLQAPGLELRLLVSARPVPAVLRLPAEPLRLAPGPGGPEPAGTTIAFNIGGARGFWKAAAEGPFAVTPADLRLAATSEQVLQVRCTAREPGRYRAPIHFVGEQQTLTLMVEAEVPPADGAPRDRDRAASARPASSAGPASLLIRTSAGGETPEEPAGGSGPRQEVRVVRGVRVLEAEPHRLKVQWPTAATGGQPVRLEKGGLKVEAGRLVETWAPFPKVTLSTRDKVTVAEIDGLAPATGHIFRVLPAQGGPEAAPFFRLDVRTPPAGRSGSGWALRLGGLALAGLLGVGAYRWYRRPATA